MPRKRAPGEYRKPTDIRLSREARLLVSSLARYYRTSMSEVVSRLAFARLRAMGVKPTLRVPELPEKVGLKLSLYERDRHALDLVGALMGAGRSTAVETLLRERGRVLGLFTPREVRMPIGAFRPVLTKPGEAYGPDVPEGVLEEFVNDDTPPKRCSHCGYVDPRHWYRCPRYVRPAG